MPVPAYTFLEVRFHPISAVWAVDVDGTNLSLTEHASPILELSAILLMWLGLAGLIGIRFRKKN